MTNEFQYLEEKWEVRDAGYAVGVATGYTPKADVRGVVFRCLSNLSRPEVNSTIRADDLSQLDDERLRRELRRALIQQAIEQSRHTWRTVEGLANETGIPQEAVLETLESLANQFMRARRPDKRGRALYTTRRKYQGTTNFVQRYLDVLNSSSS